MGRQIQPIRRIIINNQKTIEMKYNLAYDFTTDKVNHTITIKREFAAERALVWDAFTKSELLEKWFAPKPWKAVTKSMDFREGGHWLYAMVSPEGEKHWGITNYVTIKDKAGYTAKDAFTDEEGTINPALPQAVWDTSFSSNDDRTMVTIVIKYDDLSQLEETIKMGFKEGIGMSFENLDELFANK